jgi:DNA topoisomerase I
LKHFNDMICIEFTANVESDLDLVTDGSLDWSHVLKKIYDVFHPIVIQQMGTRRISKDALYVGDYEIRTGKYGPYITINKKSYGLSTYLTMSKKKLEELEEDDIKLVIQYPKTVGQHKGKDITLHIGQHSIYMKHDNKNYRLDKVTDHSLESLSSLVSR